MQTLGQVAQLRVVQAACYLFAVTRNKRHGRAFVEQTDSGDDALLRQLKIGGRLIAVVGEAPVMEMQLVTRTEEDAFNTVAVLETVVAPLENTAQRDKFVF